MKKLLVTIMSVMLIFSISQAYVVTIHGPNCTFKMNSPSDSEIILSDLKNGIRWWKVTDNSNNIIGVINNEFMMPEDNVKVTPMYEGNQIVAIQTEGGDIKYNGNKVNTVETIDGGNYEFTIEADTGYKIKSLIIDGTSTTVSSSYTFTNVNENHTIKATFEKIIPILSADWYGTPTVGETTIEKSSITSIALVDSYTPVGEVATSWNASSGQADGILTAYLEDDGSENGTYKITIAGNGTGKISANDCNCMFINFNNVIEINGLDILDTNKVTFMYAMFHGCYNLQILNVSKLDTRNVTDMGGMFRGCNALQTLDVSNFDTSKVTAMEYMFAGCTSLTNLDVSRFNTSEVTSMWAMFESCNALQTLDVSNFDTSKVTAMGYTFDGCSSLTNLDISRFNTSKVTTMQGMFSNCRNLKELNLSNFNTSSVTTMKSMFIECKSLANLNVSNFDTSEVTSMWGMFNGCRGLKNLNLSNFNTSKVTTMYFMFSGCNSLINLDLSNFDTGKANMQGVFEGVGALEQITLGEKFSFTGNGTDSCTLPYKTWYDEEGNSYTAPEIAELENPAGTYYTTNPVQ